MTKTVTKWVTGEAPCWREVREELSAKVAELRRRKESQLYKGVDKALLAEYSKYKVQKQEKA